MSHENIIEDLARALKVEDPTDEREVLGADERAGAAMTLAMAFLHNRLGHDEAARVASELFEAASRAVGHPVPPPPVVTGAAVASAGPTAPSPVPAQQRPSATVRDKAEAMLGYLRHEHPGEAYAMAHASIWSSAAFLKERFGEGEMVGYMRHIETQMSMLAMLERLPTAGMTRH